MSGTVRSLATLLATSPDNTSGLFSNANQRDFMASTVNLAATTITAAGTTQGGAAALQSHLVVVTSAAAGSGVVATLAFHKIYNRSANAVLFYPASGGNFEALAANAPVSIPAGGTAELITTSSTQGYVG